MTIRFKYFFLCFRSCWIPLTKLYIVPKDVAV
uniref:Uncharacterized protein n=1 Tax=Anguilla anguilla TaxID=7936 RepID=A0A0E9TJ80_ANGAN